MTRPKYLKITVIFESRENGGLRAYSHDVPGFHLSHVDAHRVIDDVIPALEALFRHNRNMEVTFGVVADDIRTELEGDGLIVPKGQRAAKREYIAPLPEAA